jgi:hypothetical protein
LLVLAGLALARCEQRPRGRALVLLLCGLSLFEVMPLGAKTARYPREQVKAPWVRALAPREAGAVVAIPPAQGKATADYESTVIAMLASLRHGHPLVNGYSGFFPKQSFLRRLERFPARKVIIELRALGVRYVVVERAFLDRKRRERRVRRFPQHVHAGADHVVYELGSAAYAHWP